MNEINHLITLIDSNAETEQISLSVKKVISLATSHLSYEEDLLIDNDYPDFEAHYKKHLEYRDGFYSLLAKSQKDEILEFLLSWWNHHILEEDMKYRVFFKNKDIK